MGDGPIGTGNALKGMLLPHSREATTSLGYECVRAFILTDNRVPPPWPACQMAVAKPREAASSHESHWGPPCDYSSWHTVRRVLLWRIDSKG